MVNSPSKFLSTPPDGWKPRTPATHNVMLFEALHACEVSDEQEKKHSAKKRSASSTTTSRRRRRVLMSLDNIELQEDNNNSTSQQLFSPGKTTINEAEPFAVATINAERKATRKIAAMSTANIYDEHGWIWNTQKAYQPKLTEFNLYCKMFYNTDAALTYQITKNKVELYLSYTFYCKSKPRGWQKGGGKTGVQLDYMKANKIIKVFQAAKVNKGWQ